MKEWYTALEIAELKFKDFPSSERNIRRVASKENWKSRPREGRGGGNEYHISNLPQTALDELVARALSGRNALVPVEIKALKSPVETRLVPEITDLNAKQREVMHARAVVLDVIDGVIPKIGSRERAIQHFIESAKSGTMDPTLKDWLSKANNKKNNSRTISRATIYNWYKARNNADNMAALAPVYNESFYVPVLTFVLVKLLAGLLVYQKTPSAL